MSLRVAERWALFVISALLMMVPFLAVTFSPITDLPQHLAQIRLLGEALADPGGHYEIQWWTPYGLPYTLLALTSAIAPPLWAGRLAFALVALSWVATAHWLAVRRGRSPLAAVLASLFVFCNVVYWGFLSFAIGWPVFAAWMHLTARGMHRPRQILPVALLGIVLYACHALWLLAGIAWLGFVTAVDAVRCWRERGALRPLLRSLVWTGCAVAPAVTALAIWTPRFQASAMRAPALWETSPWARLKPQWLVDAALGGMRGPLEWLLVGAVAAWVALGVAQHRERLRETIDGQLLLGAALLCLFALVLPDSYMRTIQLSERWMPFAVMLLLLAAPAPRLPAVLLRSVVVGFATAFVAVTTLTWRTFERVELAGLSAVLERLPTKPRVLGLDYQRKSALMRGRPFLQSFAWAQVLRGGTLNFSFASLSTSPVVFRSQLPPPWTPRLHLFPQHLRATDLGYFDYVIVNGTPVVHAQFTAAWRVTPVTTTGRWRLYRTS